ncbi:Na/Pi cotransporter family protein [Paracoccus limosus]|uniref:Na/Pi cotransporter family protein n=1 Tax=Paracoccus limosus TaxID=913252 RepID=A0A844HAC6_9RHOB|nr:Na/Pi cotransporter family protein [Paracoccus limosus]MTH35528.1 Na/Pi cotransporter family protein [Paracoccus limosus]
MASLLVFFQLAGAIALLLFGLGLVRDGVTDAFGMRLRMAMGKGAGTGPRAFLSGVITTLGLQSSTATALLTASFVERRMIDARMAQVLLLGANIGTALTAVMVSAGVEALAPLLLFLGYVLGRRGTALCSGLGRALIGIGLMLVSLVLLEQATLPLRQSQAVAAFLPLLDGAWPVALLFAALIAVMCSSSLAAVLLVASLVLPAGLTVVLVLGANLGGAVPAVLATAQLGAAARRVTLGNLVVRATGCVLALPLAGVAGTALAALPLPSGGLAVEAHLAFNLALAALASPLAGPLGRLLQRLVPDDDDAGAEPGPAWLDDSALATPLLALTGASREVLAVGDSVQRMLTQTRLAFRENDTAPLAEVAQIETRVDRRQQEIKTYLSRLGAAASEDDRRRSITILDYVINLEHVGDIIDKGLAPAVRMKVGLGLRFSDPGYAELDTLFVATQENLRLAQTVFLSRDRDMARRLMEIKVEIRNLERQSAKKHLIRLREGHPASRETSSLHLDMLRDLKRINAHLVSVAHPILDEEGLLIESRLRSG